MYNLGDKFINKNKKSLLSKPESVFKGSNYRITILSERLIRLEYDDLGKFNDFETAFVNNRLFPVPEFVKQEDENILGIETRYFVLKYDKNSVFSSKSLNCTSKSGKVWNYGDKEIKNAKSCMISLDNINEINISNFERIVIL